MMVFASWRTGLTCDQQSTGWCGRRSFLRPPVSGLMAAVQRQRHRHPTLRGWRLRWRAHWQTGDVHNVCKPAAAAVVDRWMNDDDTVARLLDESDWLTS